MAGSFRTEIIVVDTSSEATEDGKRFLQIIDKAGNLWKVKRQALKTKWETVKPDLAMRLTIGKYNGNDFVQDLEPCIDALQAEAAKKLQEKQKETREISIQAQVTLYVVEGLLVGKVKVPTKVKKNFFGLIEKWQGEALPK
jgi:hypothetical protein